MIYMSMKGSSAQSRRPLSILSIDIRTIPPSHIAWRTHPSSASYSCYYLFALHLKALQPATKSQRIPLLVKSQLNIFELLAVAIVLPIAQTKESAMVLGQILTMLRPLQLPQLPLQILKHLPQMSPHPIQAEGNVQLGFETRSSIPALPGTQDGRRLLGIV